MVRRAPRRAARALMRRRRRRGGRGPAASVRELAPGRSRASRRVTTNSLSTRVEEAQALGIERVHAQRVLAGQERERRRSASRRRTRALADARGREAALVGVRAVDRRAVGAHDAEEQHRRAVVGLVGHALQHQRLALAERGGCARRRRVSVHAAHDARHVARGRARRRPRSGAALLLVVGEVLARHVEARAEHARARRGGSTAPGGRASARGTCCASRGAACRRRRGSARASAMHFFWNDSSPTASTSSVMRSSGRERGGDREAQPHHHARRVVLDRLVDVLADVGEVDDRVAPSRAPRGATGPSAPLER